MRIVGRKRDIRSKAFVGILSAALVASMVPVPALAEEFEALQAADAAVTETVDAQGAADEGATDMKGELVDDVASEAGVDGTTESICLNEGATADQSGLIDDQPATSKPQVEEVGSDVRTTVNSASRNEAKSADKDETNNGEKVTYILRYWDGEKVVDEPVEAYGQAVPADGKLGSATYVVNGDVTVKKRMKVTGDAKIVLTDGCHLYAKGGIQVERGGRLEICSTGDTEGSLVIDVDHGAGIGAYVGNSGYDIVINGGTIEVHGGEHCAGIGSGDGVGEDSGSVAVFGGKVSAWGGSKGAGIGGGRKSVGRVMIYGGEVKAYAGDDAAGIGGGCDADGVGVLIRGGDVTAKGKTNSAGIGGGNNGDGGRIEISGGVVHTRHRDGAGIGGGEDGDGGEITISGGEVHSDYDGEGNGAGIGGGNHSGAGGTITITGGDVTSSTYHGAGIGGGRADEHWFSTDNSGNGGEITISGGTVHATSTYAHGIGAGGLDGWTGTNKQCEPPASGIGSGGTITIDGDADVTAKGFIAGVGGDSGTVYIKGGKLTTTGIEGEKGGRGFRFMSDDAHVHVMGGTLEANCLSGSRAIDVDNFDLYPEAMVKAGHGKDKATVLAKDKRASAYKDKNNSYVYVCPCDHADRMVEKKDDVEHAWSCKYCDKTGCEGHNFDSDHVCKKCGCTKSVPSFVSHDVLTNGMLGMEFIVELPSDTPADGCEDAAMTFAVGGKGGETVEIPLAQAKRVDDRRYGFTCYLSCIQMADEVTATFAYDGETYEDHCSLSSALSEYYSGGAMVRMDARKTAIARKMADYGHYAQLLLQRENGWKLDVDHAAMPEQTYYTAQTCQDARRMIEDTHGAISCNRAEDVGAVKLSLNMGSKAGLCLWAETDEELGAVIIDDESLGEGSWVRRGEGWTITLPAVSAKNACQGHRLVVTSKDGETLLCLDNLSPMTYAGTMLASKQTEKDECLRNALAAYANYCEACK